MGKVKWVAAGAIAAAVGTVIVGGCIKTYVYEYADGTRIETNSPNSMQLRIDVTDLRAGGATGAEEYAGHWTSQNWREPRGSVQVVVQGDEPTVRHYFHFHDKELTKINQPSAPENEFAFDVRRPSGAMSFHGTRDGQRANGDVVLKFNGDYFKELGAITGGEISTDQKLVVFRSDLPISFAKAIKDAGYAADLDALLSLRNNGISADYAVGIRKAGYDFDVQQVIKLSRNGIGKSYAIDLREAGFDLTDEQIIKLSRNGISASYAREMKAAGYGSIDDIISLSRNGVSTSYAREMGGGGKRPASGVIDMSRNGVSPSFGTDLAKLGYEFTDKDLVNLGRNGVSPSYAKSFLEAGYKFTADELVNLSRNGVGSDYARRVREAGYEPSADELIKLSRNGVSSSFIASLHDEKKPNLSIDAVIDLSRRGVDAETVKKIRGM